MSHVDAEAMAERLGLTEPVIRQLQARGYLERLAISEDELRARLRGGYLRWLRSAQLSRDLRAARRT
jgi:hypothetical protein